MSALYPFRALRPEPGVAATVASVPYDVVNTDEAQMLASGNPLSFLHVTRSEIDLPTAVGPYDQSVYEQAAANFEALKRSAPMVLDDEPSLYAYRLRMGSHEQTGLAGCFSVDEYERGLVKKHEKTRADKEDDRTRHITELRAQTGLVFLTYRAQPGINEIMGRAVRGRALYDFVAPDGVAHAIWRLGGKDRDDLVAAFGALEAVYIADGHHRAASAARARQTIAQAAGRTTDADRFVAVAFPDEQTQLLPYNRIVKDLAGLAVESLLLAIEALADVEEGPSQPRHQGEVSMFLGGRWYVIALPKPLPNCSRADSLDVEILHQHILGPLLHIGDPRTDKRIDFVGGIRGAAELERLVSSGAAAAAFSMFPVSVADLMAIADEGGIMPPKSTWFEPKLRDGLLVHLI